MTSRSLSGVSGVALALGLVVVATSVGLADDRVPYTIEVQNASAKVSLPGMMYAVVARPPVREGLRHRPA